MLNKKLISSVIIPVLNRAHLLEKPVQSVLQQTFTEFKFIIVDDDSRIKYIKCVENKGALSMVMGSVILILNILFNREFVNILLELIGKKHDK